MKEWARGFYFSTAWNETRKAYLLSQHYLCERCEQPAKIVHHRKYLTPDNIHNTELTLGWDNLEALCQDCHNQEHHRTNTRQRRYHFDESGELIAEPAKVSACNSNSLSPPITRKRVGGRLPSEDG